MQAGDTKKQQLWAASSGRNGNPAGGNKKCLARDDPQEPVHSRTNQAGKQGASFGRGD